MTEKEIEALRWRDKVHCNVIDRMAAEIERLREAIRRLAEQDATLSVQAGNVTVDIDATLSDEEREAIANVIHLIEARHDECGREAHYLRGLLERMT